MSQSPNVPISTFLSHRRSILKQIVVLGLFVGDGGTASGRRQRCRVFGGPRPGVASCTAEMLRGWDAGGAPCISGVAWRASLRVRSPNGTRAKAKKTRQGYKTVQNARGDANCARAQEGGGRGETLVLLSVLSSRDVRVQTVRLGSPRRRCSFLAAAATRAESKRTD